MSTQHVQYMLLFLVLAVNSDQFQILRSYTLLLKPPILKRSYRFYYPFYPAVTHVRNNTVDLFPLTKLQGTESWVGAWGRGFVFDMYTSRCIHICICKQCTHSHTSQQDTSYLGNASTHPDVQSHTNLQPDGASY